MRSGLLLMLRRRHRRPVFRDGGRLTDRELLRRLPRDVVLMPRSICILRPEVRYADALLAVAVAYNENLEHPLTRPMFIARVFEDAVLMLLQVGWASNYPWPAALPVDGRAPWITTG